MKNLLKSLFAAALLLLLFNTASAQVRFGVKAGVNLANISGDGVEDNKMLPTFLVGGQAEFGLSDNIGVGVGVQLSGKGVKFDAGGDDLKINPMYLQVPVQVFYHGSGFFAGVGPYVGFGIGGKFKAGGESESIDFGNGAEDDFAPLDFGAGLEAGYEFAAGPGALRVTAAYNLGLANIIPSDQRDGESAKNNVIGIALAYLFGGGD